MGDTKPDLLGETVSGDEADSMKGWTAQQGDSPPPNARELPQQFVDEQLPSEEAMKETGLSIPENQKAGDQTDVLDPADQVRLGNVDYASPLGVTANPEGAHIPGESAPPAGDKSAPELAAGAVSGTPDDTWTKADIQAYADANGIAGVDKDTQSKAEMLAAVG